jgi:hypothetical protein
MFTQQLGTHQQAFWNNPSSGGEPTTGDVVRIGPLLSSALHDLFDESVLIHFGFESFI